MPMGKRTASLRSKIRPEHGSTKARIYRYDLDIFGFTARSYVRRLGFGGGLKYIIAGVSTITCDRDRRENMGGRVQGVLRYMKRFDHCCRHFGRSL